MDAGFTTVLEGILPVAHYGEMLARLRADHSGQTLAYYMDIPWEQTLARHATKPQATEYGAAEMRSWWHLPNNLDVNIVLTWAFTLRTCVRRQRSRACG